MRPEKTPAETASTPSQDSPPFLETRLPEIEIVRGPLLNDRVRNAFARTHSQDQIDTLIAAGVDKRMVLGINNYYLSLVLGEEFALDGKTILPSMPPSTYLARLVLPTAMETYELSGEMDPSNQMKYSDESVQGKVIHKYDEIVLAHVSRACSAHCRYCFRLDLFKGSTGKSSITPVELEAYIKEFNSSEAPNSPGSNRSPIREVLLSGGDPLLLTNAQIYKYLEACAKGGVRLVRIGTKEIAFRPSRFDKNFIGMLEHFNSQYPNVEIRFVFHISHPDEFLVRGNSKNTTGTPEWIAPIKSVVRSLKKLPFVSLENQFPIIRGVNDDPVQLRRILTELPRAGIRNKYMFQCRMIEGYRFFSVPVEESFKIFSEATRGLSDSERPRLVMSDEHGKVEVIGIIGGEDGSKGKDQFVIFQRYRGPYSGGSQGTIMIARSNPNALWITDYSGLSTSLEGLGL